MWNCVHEQSITVSRPGTIYVRLDKKPVIASIRKVGNRIASAQTISRERCI